MELNAVLTYILLSISQLLGVDKTPPSDDGWNVVSPWQDEGRVEVFEASSEAVVSLCRAKPNSYLEFPSIIHGAHEILLDGTLVSVFGDKRFGSVRSFYGAPYLRCSDVASGQKLAWKAFSYSKYFARVQFYPRLVPKVPRAAFFSESINLIAAGSFMVMAFFTLLIFWNKVPHSLSLSIAAANLSLSVYFLATVAGLATIQIKMIEAHKTADVGLWIGMLAFFNAFRVEGLIKNKIYIAYFVNVLVALLFIVFGNSGDMIQFGTTLPFALSLIMGFSALARVFRGSSLRSGVRKSVFAALSMACFVSVCVNDVLVVIGLSHGQMWLSAGFLAGLFFFALSVNEKISTTYRERDFLRGNLEQEVTRKTQELNAKTVALEAAMLDLRSAQAEIVQSAKLASLGTLAAGIAHEINNSLNFVYGGLRPLEKMISECQDERIKPKALKLTSAMQQGLRLTFEIIKSLRSYTGLNQARHTDYRLAEVIESILTMIKGKLSEKIKVTVGVPGDLELFGNVVGVSQVFMNLITNAIDAMPEGGEIKIQASLERDSVFIKVIDAGTGMPEELKARIFDPFFTTKRVGKGTGLGLYIVKTEIERQGGKLSVVSEVGNGTEFTIELPAVAPEKKAAA